MAHNTTNTSAFIEAQQYSQFILDTLKDGLLPEATYRNVSDFPAGTTLNIKTVGAATIQEVAEDTAITYNPIDTGSVTLTITDYIGDAWYITDVLRQDGAQVEQLHAMRGMESTRAIQERFETRLLAAADAAQTKTGDVNLVNGRPHRWVAGGSGATDRIIDLADIIAMKLSFDKANVPQFGRVLVVDPVVEASLNSLITSTSSVDANPKFQAVTENGFAREHKFLMNLFGFDIWTSNRLPVLTATEALDASGYGLANDTAEVGDIVNVAMSLADDSSKPMMAAWRQMPNVEGERNKDKGRDEFVTRARWGVGAQRVDTLGTIITHPSNY